MSCSSVEAGSLANERDIGGIVGEILRAEYFGLFRPENVVRTLTLNVPTLVVPRNAERISLAIVCTGVQSVRIAPSNELVKTSGIILISGGGSLTTNIREDGMLPTEEWWAMALNDDSSCYALGIVRDIQIEDA
jgi:hypothetical protein